MIKQPCVRVDLTAKEGLTPYREDRVLAKLPTMSRELKGSMIEILEAIENIESFTKDLTFEEFSNNLVVIRQVAKDFAIIEKASKHIPGMSKRKFLQNSLKAMTDIRNRMIPIHVYMKPGVMWDAAKNDLPALKALIEEFLDDFGSE